MKKTVLPRPCHAIEALEARIAPAVLVAGGNLLGGAGNPSAGDYSIGDNVFQFVKVLSGQAVVWFNGTYATGISVGPNTSLEIKGDIFGDIVANLGADGRITDSDNNPANGLDGGILLANNITGITIKGLNKIELGSVGNIITGGSIAKLNIEGKTQGIYAGDGVYNADSDLGSSGSFQFSVGIDVNPIQAGAQSSFTLAKSNALMTPGAGISNVSIGDGVELQVFAGSGNPTNAVFLNSAGPAGGNVDGLTIQKTSLLTATSSNPSYKVIAGDGASGKTGGAGGSVSKITEKSSVGLASIKAGNGGTGSAGAGGAGGSIRATEFGSLSAKYVLVAGNGGVGTTGGAGGTVASANFSNLSQGSSLVATGDLNGDGTDESVLLDASSGDFVVAKSTDAGETFTLVTQYINTDVLPPEPVYVVKGTGLASDLDITDVNGDGSLDVVVTYSDSGSIVAYINQGNGSFYDAVKSDYETTTYSYLDANGFKAALTEVVGDHFVVAALNKNRSLLATVPFGENAGATHVVKGVSSLVTALKTTPSGDTFAGFASGEVIGVTTSGSANLSSQTVGGPVSSMSVGDGGNSLAVLSKDRKVSVFALSPGANMAPDTTIDLAGSSGVLLQVAFVDDHAASAPDKLVLSRLSGSSAYDVYQRTVTVPTFSLATTVSADTAFKQFAIADTGDGGFAFVGVTASANSFGFAKNLANFDEYALPFNGKQVQINSGRGGDGINVGKILGKGGAGGSITSVNIEAVNVILTAGAGGASQSGAGGAGGSINNPAIMVTSSGSTLSPVIHASETLDLFAADGGSAAGPLNKAAAGGAGGGFSGLSLSLDSGNIHMTAGAGGVGNGGAGGAGGGFTNIRAVGGASGISAIAGSGGATDGSGAKGGAGGGFSGFGFSLVNDPVHETLEIAYDVTLVAGSGGNSAQGIGGAGGGFVSTTLKLDGADRTYDGHDANNEPVVDAHEDSTVTVTIFSGNGGSGVAGGKGGDITGTKISTVHDQNVDGLYYVHYIAAQIEAGDGGAGSTGDGGAGGSISSTVFTGVTYFDPDSLLSGTTPLYIAAGNGGSGGGKGGAGGTIASLVAQNGPGEGGGVIQHTHLGAAEIYAGRGGDGGNGDGGTGGNLSGLLVGSQFYLFAVAGDGGNGGVAAATLAKGGAGGAVSNSTLALIQSASGYAGLVSTAGNGGSGRSIGGAGGALSALTVNLPYAPSGLGAVLTAGDGGSASNAGATGGKGGDVTGVSNTKDIHSAISLIEAGNGGDAPVGKGGNGGNVSNIRVSGFIGRVLNDMTALGAFDPLGVGSAFGATVHTQLVSGVGSAQGLFVGRAGAGQTAGLAGSVTTVQAEAISAIGAAVNSSGIFALAEKVTSVKASFIGYDANGNGSFDSGNPGATRPVDGFILAKALSLVTGSRTGFVFNS